MYFSLLGSWVSQARRSLWRAAVTHSGILTLLAFAIALLVLAWGWKEHQHGRFAQLKAGLKEPANPQVTSSTRPGGQEPLVLERSQIQGTTEPEFLRAILLPGRGMNLFQIDAYIPQKGTVQLLASPPLENVAKQFNGTGPDASGAASLSVGGAYEVPWAGRLYGNVSNDGKSLNIAWGPHMLNLPATWHNGGLAAANGGLLLKRASTIATINVMPDGGEAQAVFDAGNFDGHWFSKTKVTTTVQLNSHAIEMKMVAQNSGDQPEPMGLGWQSRFAILSPERTSVRLRLPSETKTEINRKNGMPTGRLLTSTAPEREFASRDGAPLGALDLDDTFVHLHQDLMGDGPVLEIRDLANDYGLRITTLSPTIKVLHVYAPADQNFISIAPRFNYDDPFGREWSMDEDAGMVTLAPSKSVEWHIRLEIFALSSAAQRM